MLGKLIPNGGGPPILLLRPRLLVGRQPTCDIPISMPFVSSRHCELEMLDGYWHVRDLDSTTGTRRNGTACKEAWLLPKDGLGLGQARFLLEYAPPLGRPSPRRASPAAGNQPAMPAEIVRKAAAVATS